MRNLIIESKIIKLLLSIALLITMIVSWPLTAYAAPRSVPFSVGQTLDPGAELVEPCGPLDTNCYPSVSVSSSSATFGSSTINNYFQVLGTSTLATTTVSNLFANNIQASNATITNATTTNLFTSILNALTSFISNLLFNNATGTNLAVSNLNATNTLTVGGQVLSSTTIANINNIATTTGTSTFNIINSTSSNITNLNATNSTTTGNAVVTGTTTLATTTITNGNITNLIAGNSTTTNATSTNFYATNASTTNSTSTNAFANNLVTNNSTSTNLFATNASVTNSTSTNLFSSLLSALTSVITNLFATNANITYLAASTTNTGSLTSSATSTFNGTVILNSEVRDSTGATGTAGQILSSTGTSTKWIDVVTGSSTGTTTFNILNSTTSNVTNLISSNSTNTNSTTTNSYVSSLVTSNSTTTGTFVNTGTTTLSTTTIANLTSGNTTITGVFNAATSTLATTTLAQLTVLGKTFLGTVASGTASDTIILVRDQLTGEIKQTTLAAVTSATTGSISFATTTGILTLNINGVPSTTTINQFANLTIGNASIGNATASNIFATNASITNATATSFFASIFNALSAIITNLVSTNSTSTNATSTNLFASVFNSINSIISNLTATNATITNATSTNFNTNNLFAVNSNITNSTTSNSVVTGNSQVLGTTTLATTTIASATLGVANIQTLNIGGSIVTNFSSSSLSTTSNATVTNTLVVTGTTTLSTTTITNLTAGNSTTTNSTSTNSFATNLITTNSTSTNSTSTNLYSSNASITNATATSLFSSILSALSAVINNLTTTNSTNTNSTSTNLFASTFNALTSFIANLTTTNSTTTNSTTTGNLVSTGLTTLATTTVSNLTLSSYLQLNGGIKDSTGATGTLGQVLSSTGTSTKWITVSSGSSFASGTATGSTLYWNGTSWTENLNFLVSASGNATMTNATATNLYVSGATTIAGTTTFSTTTINNFLYTSASGTNSTNTNSTSTNLFGRNVTIGGPGDTVNSFSINNGASTGSFGQFVVRSFIPNSAITFSTSGPQSIRISVKVGTVGGNISVAAAPASESVPEPSASSSFQQFTFGGAPTTTVAANGRVTTDWLTYTPSANGIMISIYSNTLGLRYSETGFTGIGFRSYYKGDVTGADFLTQTVTGFITTAQGTLGVEAIESRTLPNGSLSVQSTSTLATATIASSSITYLNVLSSLWASIGNFLGLNVSGTTTLATTTATQLSLSRALVLASSTSLSTTSQALYNNNGTLYFNGAAVGGASVFTQSSNNIVLSSTTASSTVSINKTVGNIATTWSTSSPAVNNAWKSVAYGNGTWVAVSQDGVNQVMTSTNGITWTARTAASSALWYSVTYGNGLFVAVSLDGLVMTSPDGITWTSRVAAAANTWTNVAYGNGLFVAISTASSLMTSPDGITWTSRAAPAVRAWFGLAYGNGTWVASASDLNTTNVMSSTDGINWTIRTSAAAVPWYDVAYGNGLFVAVSDTGANRVMTSTDGITWTAGSGLLLTSNWRAVTYGEGYFVAVANVGTNQIMTSPNGVNWTSVTTPQSAQWDDVAYGNGRFVSVQDSLSNTIMSAVASTGNIISIASSANSLGVIVSENGRLSIGTTTTANVLNINGGITLASNAVTDTSNALYNNNGTLYFNGAAVGGSSLPASTTSLFVGANGGVGVGTSTNAFGGSLTQGLTLGQTATGGQNIANVLVLGNATSTSLVSTSTNALYNVNGSLYFNGSVLGQGVAASYMYAHRTAVQPGTTGDHANFTSIANQFGTDITLDTASGYSTLTGTASQGRFTLKAGKTYKLTGNLGTVQYLSAVNTNYVNYGWYNADTGTLIGRSTTIAQEYSGGGTESSGSDAIAIFTPTTDTRVELRVLAQSNFSNISGGTFPNDQARAIIEVIAGNAAVTGQTVDYVSAIANTNTYSNAAALPANTTSGNIPNTNGVFTLSSGKTYRLQAAVKSSQTVSTMSYQWRDITNNVLIGAQGSSASNNAGSAISDQLIAEAVYTPTTTVTVRLENTTGAARTINGSSTWIMIQQLGTTAVTGDSVVAVGGNSVSGTGPLSIGTLTNNALQFITNNILDLFIGTSTNIGIGTSTNQYGGTLASGLTLGAVISGGQSTSNVLVLNSATSTSLVSTSTNALYNVNGSLYFNGSAISTSTPLYGVTQSNVNVGSSPSSGATSTFATTDSGPIRVAIDNNGNIFTTNLNAGTVNKITPNGVSTVFATVGSNPQGIAIDNYNNIYVANVGSGNISKITQAGVVSTLPTIGGAFNDIAFDSLGNLYTANGGGNSISKVTPSGVVTSPFATVGSSPTALAFDSQNNIFVTNSGPGTISKVTPSGVVTTIFANLGATKSPNDIVFDSVGNMYTANLGDSTISKVTPSGVVTATFASIPGASPQSLIIDRFDNLYTVGQSTNLIYKITASGVVSTFASLGSGKGATYLAIDNSGNIYSANRNDNSVSQVTGIAFASANSNHNGYLNVQGTASNTLNYFTVASSTDSTIFVVQNTGGVGIGTNSTNGLGSLIAGLTLGYTASTTLGNIADVLVLSAATSTSLIATSSNALYNVNGQLYFNNSNLTNFFASSSTAPSYAPSFGLATNASNSALQIAKTSSAIGAKWIAQTAPATANYNSIAYGNGKFVAGSNSTAMMTSTDGVNWTANTAPNIATGIAFGNGVFVASVNNNANSAMTSPDGITWTTRSTPSLSGQAAIAIAYGNGKFVIVSSSGVANGAVAYSSDNGVTWNSAVAAGSGWNAVTYGNGLYVAAGGVGPFVMTSPDAITWTSRVPTGVAGNLGLAYGNGVYVGVSNLGVMISTDGITWTTPPGSPTGLNDVTFGNGLFVAVGNGVIYTSPNGTTWTLQTAPNSVNYSAATYGNGLFVTVALTGTANQRIAISDTSSKAVFSAGSTNYNNTLWVGDNGSVGLGTTTNQYGGAMSAGLNLGYNTTGGQSIANVLVMSSATSTSLISTSTNALYNVNGQLYFNGSSVATQWVSGSSALSYTGSVAVGTTTPLVNAMFTVSSEAGTSTTPTMVAGIDSNGYVATGTGNMNGSQSPMYAVYGKYLYEARGTVLGTCSGVAASNNGCELKIYDISNPALPVYVNGIDSSGSLNSGNGNNGFNSLTIKNGYLYIAAQADTTACTNTAGSAKGCEVQVYDLTDPSTPKYIAGIDVSGSVGSGTGANTVSGIMTYKDYLITILGGNATACSSTVGSAIGCEIQIYTLAEGGLIYKTGIDVSGTVNGGTSNVTLWGADIDGTTLYVSTNGDATTCSNTAGGAVGCEIQMYDISNINTPVYLGGADSSGFTGSGTNSRGVYGIKVSDGYLYSVGNGDSTACSLTPGSAVGCEIKVWDVRYPGAISYVAGMDSSAALGSGTSVNNGLDVFVDSNRLYVSQTSGTTCSGTAGNAAGCEVLVFNVTTPTSPVYLYGIDRSGAVNSGTDNGSATSLFVSGSYLYIGYSGDPTLCTGVQGTSVGCETQIFKIGANSNNRNYALAINGKSIGNSWDLYSDRTLKENILDLSDDSLSNILKLRSVTYNFIGDDRTRNGFIAQEVKEVMPGLVADNGSGLLTMDYIGLISPIVKAIQEMNVKLFATNSIPDNLDIEELTASTTISMDTKIKALGLNMNQVNAMLAELASSTSATTTATDTYDILTNATTSTTTDTFFGKVINAVIGQVKTFLANASEVFIGKVKTKEICIQDDDGNDICLTAKQLKSLVGNNATSSISGASVEVINASSSATILPDNNSATTSSTSTDSSAVNNYIVASSTESTSESSSESNTEATSNSGSAVTNSGEATPTESSEAPVTTPAI